MRTSLLLLALVAPLAAVAAPRLADPIAAETQANFVESKSGPKTRAEVRDELERARATNTLTPAGEMGDTPEVLAAREAFAELQREVMLANRERLIAERSAALAIFSADRAAPLPAYANVARR